MRYRQLGHTGVQVSTLCLGTMLFGPWGNPDHEDSIRIIHRALDAGINFVDTADVYAAGESEQIVGKALRGRRDDVVLATKFHGPMGDDRNRRGASRRWIVRAVEDSLRRLGTDWIDLYQVHRPEPDVDIDETLGALTDLVRSGKVRYLGSSTFPAHAIVDAQWTAQRRGRERFVCEQPPYSMLVRGIEADVLPVCERHGMGVICWSPLAGGWLSGRDDLTKPGSNRAERIPARFDMTLAANQAKLEAARSLDRGRGRRGHRADPHGARIRLQPPGGDRGDRRLPHDGAAREPARSGRCRPRRGGARPDRRDRPAGHEPEPCRRGLGRAQPHRPGAAAALTPVAAGCDRPRNPSRRCSTWWTASSTSAATWSSCSS